MSDYAIRPVTASDDMARLTDLIHEAYAAQLARGLRYWGTHQSVEDTAKRFASGQGFIAETDGKYVGTITVRPPQPQSPVVVYREPGTWSFCQFAVAPAMKGKGLGKALHEAALAHARANGATTMGLDTAQPASALIAMYRAWGYEAVGEQDWRPHTNYMSVVMLRAIAKG